MDDQFSTCFWLEIKGLVGNIYPDNVQYKKNRNFYGFYLFNSQTQAEKHIAESLRILKEL